MTHEERLALIHRPFFITTFGTSYPWGGCAVADNFFDPNGGNWAQRVHPARDGGRLIVTTGLNDGTTNALSTLSLPEALKRSW